MSEHQKAQPADQPGDNPAAGEDPAEPRRPRRGLLLFVLSSDFFTRFSSDRVFSFEALRETEQLERKNVPTRWKRLPGYIYLFQEQRLDFI